MVPNDIELNNDLVELILVPNDVELNNDMAGADIEYQMMIELNNNRVDLDIRTKRCRIK